MPSRSGELDQCHVKGAFPHIAHAHEPFGRTAVHLAEVGRAGDRQLAGRGDTAEHDRTGAGRIIAEDRDGRRGRPVAGRGEADR